MTPLEQKYLEDNIRLYEKNIEGSFGAEDARVYGREVRKALGRPTGRGIRDFLKNTKRG
jgi:hypothetical protein